MVPSLPTGPRSPRSSKKPGRKPGTKNKPKVALPPRARLPREAKAAGIEKRKAPEQIFTTVPKKDTKKAAAPVKKPATKALKNVATVKAKPGSKKKAVAPPKKAALQKAKKTKEPAIPPQGLKKAPKKTTKNTPKAIARKPIAKKTDVKKAVAKKVVPKKGRGRPVKEPSPHESDDDRDPRSSSEAYDDRDPRDFGFPQSEPEYDHGTTDNGLGDLPRGYARDPLPAPPSYTGTKTADGRATMSTYRSPPRRTGPDYLGEGVFAKNPKSPKKSPGKGKGSVTKKK